MKWIPKYQSGNKTKYASAAKDANTGEFHILLIFLLHLGKLEYYKIKQ